jgi:hypothetical protein
VSPKYLQSYLDWVEEKTEGCRVRALGVDIVDSYRDGLDADLSNAAGVSSRAPTDEPADTTTTSLSGNKPSRGSDPFRRVEG